MIEAKQIKKNVSLTISVQIVSFFVSLVMNLLLPKFIDEEHYSYWQTFLLYIGYVPLLHLGILDGLMLRYSQYDYNELDKPLVRSQFTLFFLMELVFASSLIIGSFFVSNEIARLIVAFSGIAVISTNLFTYTSYTFQLTNRISKYAKLVLLDKLVLGVGVIVLMVVGAKYFYQICYVYFAARFSAIAWGYFHNKELYFGKIVALKKAVCEYKENFISGFMLLLANLSSMFMVGGAKMVVQWRYDTFLFGQIAFAFNASNLFLTFVTAASVALFPSIKRIDPDKLPIFYDKIRGSISLILFVALIFYFPCYKILQLWLPNYAESLVFWGILMPIIIFSSKVTLLTNNYLKAYRKEKIMLKINLISVIIAFASYLVSAYGFNNIILLLLCLDVVIMLRSVASEIVVMKLINKNFFKDFALEFFIVATFILCAIKLSLLLGFGVYSLAVALYFIINRKNCKTLLKFKRF